MALYSSVLQMYLNWANSLLCERGVLVTDAEELQDGRIFALLIDVLNNAEITCAETEDEDETALNQIQAIFNYLSQHGIKLKSSPKDIMKGDVKSLLDLLWVIILHFTIHSKETPPGRRTLRYGRLSLMEWCADQLTEENFKMHKSITENFKGNNKLAELIEIYSHVSTEDDQESSPVGRLSTALIAVEETLGILKSLLSPADVIHGTANEYSVIIFLALLKRKVNLLVPDLGTEPSPPPAPYQDTAEGTSEPWASLLHNTFSFKFVRVESLRNRLNLLKSSLAANASSPNAPTQDVTFDDSGQGEEKRTAMGCESLMDVPGETVACRLVEDSSGLQSHIGQPLTNGVLNQSGRESSHCSSEKERDTENDRTGGKHLSSISHGATGSHVTQNDIIRKDNVEDEVSIPGVKMQGSRVGDLHRIGGTSKNDEENTSDWHISSNQVDAAIDTKNFSLDAADDYPVAAAKYSFEDELLSLLETIGTEGKQLRQKLDSAQEREVYLLGQLQETVSGKHEEKVIARLIQELEMLRKENRRLFRELADARGEVSLKKQKFDALQRHCHLLEGEMDRLKSGAGSAGSSAGQGVGYRNGTESRVEESREENEMAVKSKMGGESALEKLMKRTAEENKQLRAELSSYRKDSSQTSKRYETTRDALRNVEEDNRDLRVKCQKLTRNIENMTVDLQTKEKRMGRYERYLEILRKQNGKLISHIGGEPLRGDGRVDVAKMELEEVKVEYKELRKRLEIAEEDRILLNKELDQIKAGDSRINSDAIDSVFQEFHNLPRSDIKKSKDDMNVSEADAVPKFPIAGSSLTSGKEDSSIVINEVISGRGEAEGSSNEVETAVKVLPEVKRSAATRSQLSDVSSLRSYDVSESETMQSDSDYACEEYGSRTRATHGGLVDGGVGGHVQRSFRSPSLGSLIRAHAMEDLRDGEADETAEKMGGRVSEASHGEGPRRVVVGSVVADRADSATSKGTKTLSSRPSENYHLEHSIYYTPTLNLPMKRQPFEGRLDYETLPVNSRTPYKGRLAASRSETDISDRKRNTSGKTHLNTVQSESNLNHKPTEGAMYSSQYGSQKVHQIISGSSWVPRWRQLRYSRAKYLPPSKTGEPLANPLPRSSPSKNVPLLYQSTPLTEGDVDRVERYYTPTAFMDGFATSHPSSPRNLNIPLDNEEEEFQPLPDQLTEPKKLADVTPPRNQNVSPRNHSSSAAAVKMKLSFEEANPKSTLEKRKSPTVLTLDENKQNTYPELDDKIVGGFASGGKMEHRGMEGGAADVMALRVIRKADSGISLSSAGYDNPSHPNTSKEVSYIHKMLSPADQSYANSIIDKYLTKN